MKQKFIAQMQAGLKIHKTVFVFVYHTKIIGVVLLVHVFSA